MTEEEAKTKWCPMVRAFTSWWPYGADTTAPTGGAAAINRDSPNTNRYNCIGSSCMMWRTTVAVHLTNDPIKFYRKEEIGYCGLAGKPE